MNDDKGPQPDTPNLMEMADNFARIAAQSQQIVNNFLARQQSAGNIPEKDPLNVGEAFNALTQRMLADPAKLVQAQMAHWQDHMKLWQHTAARMMGTEPPEPIINPGADDRRFRDPAWSENHYFDFIKQSYLLTAAWLQSTVNAAEGLDPKTAAKVDFYTRQFIDAAAPTNFALSNPAVLQETIATKGDNLLQGLQNMLDDLERGEGKLDIRMTDEEAFEVGGNIAVCPGKVVFQNELMQLIQYAPETETVYRRPLMIVPPWINKFYILDLKPENSFVAWAVAQGYTVFMVSWINPDARLADKSFEDYMQEGILGGLDAIEAATGVAEINLIGYCLGGTLLASTLAYLKAKGDKRIKSATFLAALVDFSDPGELGVFIDEEQLDALDKMMDEQGFLEGRHMAQTFNMLRANDLIWSFVINNYLMGKDPFPFDLLYWNGDSTRMPAAMHRFYLRNMYQENLLVQPGGITLADTPIDLRDVDTPIYILAARDDHIAPWESVFKATGLYSGDTRFVLGASGHIAGVVNPPAKGKYSYWTAPIEKGETAAGWLDRADENPGSWWTDWHSWQAKRAGKKVPARVPGDSDLDCIEDAPGSYVLAKA